MNSLKINSIPLLAAAMFLLPGASSAGVFEQCGSPDDGAADVVCMHLGAGDGFVKMGDGESKYIFSFSDLTGIADPGKAMAAGQLAANFPAPTIALKEGDRFYLSLTNVGMIQRPDLFDPHTVHFHGFPNASAIFDGVPDSTVSINAGASLTYFYNVTEPGTFMYHCHVEATEHMQMGMLGNLYVQPAQNRVLADTDLNGYIHQTGDEYVYNDGDGSTRYDIAYPVQLGSFDGAFHDASRDTQPLPFALMKDDYAMLNGRGYPDTTVNAPLTPPDESWSDAPQPVSSLITADAGQKVLLRLSNLNVTNHYTVTALGFTMQVVGTGAHILRGQNEDDLYYGTNSVTLGGGEAMDVIIDTSGVAPGKYFLYTTNLNFLSNGTQDYGGMMTEIVIN
jgi:FtsP/CotA-like multicopper oxidase with cupredoxin domain